MMRRTVSAERSESTPPWRNLNVSLRQALVVAAALLLGGFLGWLLFADHGGGPSGGRAAIAPTKLRVATYPTIGLGLAQPTTWHGSLQRGVVRLLSSDQSVSVAISAPAAAGQDAQLRRADATDLRRLFRPSRLLGRQRGKIGGLPALITELVGTSPRRSKIRILSTALSSPYRSYSIQVFTALRPSSQRLLELRSVLASVRFSALKN